MRRSTNVRAYSKASHSVINVAQANVTLCEFHTMRGYCYVVNCPKKISLLIVCLYLKVWSKWACIFSVFSKLRSSQATLLNRISVFSKYFLKYSKFQILHLYINHSVGLNTSFKAKKFFFDILGQQYQPGSKIEGSPSHLRHTYYIGTLPETRRHLLEHI